MSSQNSKFLLLVSSRRKQTLLSALRPLQATLQIPHFTETGALNPSPCLLIPLSEIVSGKGEDREQLRLAFYNKLINHGLRELNVY